MGETPVLQHSELELNSSEQLQQQKQAAWAFPPPLGSLPQTHWAQRNTLVPGSAGVGKVNVWALVVIKHLILAKIQSSLPRPSVWGDSHFALFSASQSLSPSLPHNSPVPSFSWTDPFVCVWTNYKLESFADSAQKPFLCSSLQWFPSQPAPCCNGKPSGQHWTARRNH